MRKPAPRRRRIAAAATLVACTSASAWALFPRIARADASFSGEATSVGLSVTATTEEDPTGTTVEAAEPIATATLSSVPDSEAFAAYPYPGTDLLNLVNLLGASLPAPPPPYPLEVQSSSPGQSSRSVSEPGYLLSADSNQSMSHARGESGVDNNSVHIGNVGAEALVETSADGLVRAIADSTAKTVAIGPLTISSFDSHAEADLTASGDHKTTSRISVGTAAVNGQPVGLTDQGLTVAGTNVPLPDTSTAAEVLRQAGIELTYLSAQPGGGSIVAPGIAITVKERDPQGRNATVTYTLGRAAADATQGVGVSFPSIGSGDGSIGAVGPPTAIPNPSSQAGLFDGSALGSASIQAPSAPGPSMQAATSRHTGAPSSISPVLAGEPGSLDGIFFYLLLVLAAGAALAVGQLIRFLGVR